MVWSTYPLSHHQRTQVRAALWILRSQVTFSNSARPHQRWRRSGSTEIHAHSLYHKKCNDMCARMHYRHKNTQREELTHEQLHLHGQTNTFVHMCTNTKYIGHKHKLCNSSSFVPSSTLNKLFSFITQAVIQRLSAVCHSYSVQQPESSVRGSNTLSP